MSQHDLELLGLRKVYPDGTVAVQGFDLKVERGEFISFVGPSGCGKTTTLRMIAGLEDITAGELLIRGANMTNVSAEKRPTATIFQNYAVFPHMTVRKNIEFGLAVRKLPSSEIKRRVDEIIEKLQLTSVADARDRSLSGGQRQRLALARGLVTEPEILLLDEPLGALDANLRKSIQEELRILQRDLNITFVFVTHAQSEALSMGDRVVVMNGGRIEQVSAPFELYTRPKNPFVAKFIGHNKILEGTLAKTDGNYAVAATRFGELSGVPSFDTTAGRADAPVLVVVPSEYVSVSLAGAADAAADSDRISGTIRNLDVVGHIAHLTVELDAALSVQIASHVEKIAGRGVEPGSKVDLTWSAQRATIVLDDSSQ